jgi:hypothetical protein
MPAISSFATGDPNPTNFIGTSPWQNHDFTVDGAVPMPDETTDPCPDPLIYAFHQSHAPLTSALLTLWLRPASGNAQEDSVRIDGGKAIGDAKSVDPPETPILTDTFSVLERHFTCLDPATRIDIELLPRVRTGGTGVAEGYDPHWVLGVLSAAGEIPMTYQKQALVVAAQLILTKGNRLLDLTKHERPIPQRWRMGDPPPYWARQIAELATWAQAVDTGPPEFRTEALDVVKRQIEAASAAVDEALKNARPHDE